MSIVNDRLESASELLRGAGLWLPPQTLEECREQIQVIDHASGNLEAARYLLSYSVAECKQALSEAQIPNAPGPFVLQKHNQVVGDYAAYAARLGFPYEYAAQIEGLRALASAQNQARIMGGEVPRDLDEIQRMTNAHF